MPDTAEQSQPLRLMVFHFVALLLIKRKLTGFHFCHSRKIWLLQKYISMDLDLVYMPKSANLFSK